MKKVLLMLVLCVSVAGAQQMTLEAPIEIPTSAVTGGTAYSREMIELTETSTGPFTVQPGQFGFYVPPIYVCEKGHEAEGVVHIYGADGNATYCAQCFIEFLDKKVPRAERKERKP